MTYPIPPGTRDVLPDEMRELRGITRRLRAVFEGGGYGEVWTPTLEYEEVLRTGDERAAGAGYRLFDESGQVLAMRSDMTIPIARLVATRYADAASRPSVSSTSRTPTGRRSPACRGSSSRAASSSSAPPGPRATPRSWP